MLLARSVGAEAQYSMHSAASVKGKGNLVGDRSDSHIESTGPFDFEISGGPDSVPTMNPINSRANLYCQGEAKMFLAISITCAAVLLLDFG